MGPKKTHVHSITIIFYDSLKSPSSSVYSESMAAPGIRIVSIIENLKCVKDAFNSLWSSLDFDFLHQRMGNRHSHPFHGPFLSFDI